MPAVYSEINDRISERERLSPSRFLEMTTAGINGESLSWIQGKYWTSKARRSRILIKGCELRQMDFVTDVRSNIGFQFRKTRAPCKFTLDVSGANLRCKLAVQIHGGSV